MDNRSVALIVIRAFGIYFAAQAALDFMYLISYALDLMANISLNDYQPSEDRLGDIKRGWTNVSFQAAELILMVGLSIYFFKGGKFFHKLLLKGTGEA